MRVLRFFVCLLLIVSCRHAAPDAHLAFTRSDAKPGVRFQGGKLGILPFDCEIPATGAAVSDVVSTNLRVGTPLTVVDQLQLENALRDKGLSASGIAQGKEYSKLGVLSGDIDYLLIGQVAVYSPTRSIITGATAKLVDVRTGEMLITATYTPPKKGWGTAQYAGDSLGAAIKKEVSRSSGP